MVPRHGGSTTNGMFDLYMTCVRVRSGRLLLSRQQGPEARPCDARRSARTVDFEVTWVVAIQRLTVEFSPAPYGPAGGSVVHSRCWDFAVPLLPSALECGESSDSRIAHFAVRLKRWRDLIAKVSDSITLDGTAQFRLRT